MSATTKTVLSAYVNGLSVIGPGLLNWADSVDVLSGTNHYETAPTVLPSPKILPPAERRRSGQLVKLTLAVGLEAAQLAGEDPANLACVYTSSSGDGKNCHEICQTLASDDRQISPTRFHNSVHNAAAGYWSIATGAQTPISVLCAHDASFGAGLLETITQVVTDQISTILIATDSPYPEPLHHARPISDAFGLSMVFSPNQTKQTVAKIQISLTHEPATELTDPALETLRAAIPAARGLPIITAIAKKQSETISLDYLDHTQILVEITPC